MDKETKKQMMAEERIETLIPRMAVPTIVAQLIQTVYNLADTYFVSGLGTNATAAVGVNSSLEKIISLMGNLLAAGACSYIARLLGAKREKDADRVLSTAFFTGLGAGLIIMIVCSLILEPLVYFLGANEDCAVYSMQYATYVLYAAPFMIGSFILNMCLRSEGSATFSMIGIGFGGILNCFLDPIFIYGMDLGVLGASMATAISKLISFLILLYPYVRKKSVVHLSFRKIKYVWEDIKNVVTIGSTSFFRMFMLVISNILLNRVAGTISTSVMAAVSIANRVLEFPFAFILGFGLGYQPVVGFNWGAKNWQRVKDSYKFGIKVSIIGSIIMGGLIIVLAPWIVTLFNKQADPEVMATGILCIRLQCATMIAHSFGSITNMFYAGIGRAKEAVLLSTSRQGYCFIPCILILPALLGVTGIASAQAVADLVTFAISIPLCVKAIKLINEKMAEDG